MPPSVDGDSEDVAFCFEGAIVDLDLHIDVSAFQLCADHLHGRPRSTRLAERVGEDRTGGSPPLRWQSATFQPTPVLTTDTGSV